VAYLSGTITAKKADGSSRLLTVKSGFDEGDVISTAQDSYARLKFIDGSEIALRPSTTLDVKSVRFNEQDQASDNFAVGLLKGGMRAVTGLIGKRSKEKVQYNTQVATIGIRGTHFGLMLCQADDCKGLQTLGGKPLKHGLYADEAAGSTEIANKAGSLILDAGHFAYVADENTPPEEVTEDDAFRVMLPFSVLFDESTQVWSDGTVCNACVMH
jgi:hypothetical protein